MAGKEQQDLQLQHMKLQEEYIFPVNTVSNSELKRVKLSSRERESCQLVCNACSRGLKSLQVARSHITNEIHKIKVKEKKLNQLIPNLPPPSPEHLQSLGYAVEHSFREQSAVAQGQVEVRKMIATELQGLVQRSFPDVTVELFGSSVSGFALVSSNVNLNLNIPGAQERQVLIPPVMKGVLEMINHRVETYCGVKDDFYAFNKIPRILFMHKTSGLKCEIRAVVGNPMALSPLLGLYGSLDERALKLGVLFRYWAKVCKVDQQENGHYPSHMFIVMVIHYLQQRNPPVLPVLHELKDQPEATDDSNKSADPTAVCYLDDRSAVLEKWQCHNTETVAELWYGLLKYYAVDFKVGEHAVTILQSGPLLCIDRQWGGTRLAVEDPLIPRSNLGRAASSDKVSCYLMSSLKQTLMYFGNPSQLDLPHIDSISSLPVQHGNRSTQVTSSTKEVSLKSEVGNEVSNLQKKVSEIHQDKKSEDKTLQVPSTTTSSEDKAACSHKESVSQRESGSEATLSDSTESNTLQRSDRERKVQQTTHTANNPVSEAIKQHAELEVQTEQGTTHAEPKGCESPCLETLASKDKVENSTELGDSSIVFAAFDKINSPAVASNTEPELGISFVSESHLSKQLEDHKCDQKKKSRTPSVSEELPSDIKFGSFSDEGSDGEEPVEVKAVPTKKQRGNNCTYNVESVTKTQCVAPPLSMKTVTTSCDEEDVSMQPAGRSGNTEKSQSLHSTNKANSLGGGTSSDSHSCPKPVSSEENLKVQRVSSPLTTAATIYSFQISNFVFQPYPKACLNCKKINHIALSCPTDELSKLRLPEQPPDQHSLARIGVIFKDHMGNVIPRQNHLRMRKEICDYILTDIKRIYPKARLQLFGSSANGFGSFKSDLDICMTLDGDTDSENSSVITAVAEELYQHKERYWNIVPITHARVPIVKFYLLKWRLQCDISLENQLAVRNTQMLAAYANIDERVQLLGYALKEMAKVCDMCDASTGSLSSYAYILLLLHYLQRVSPPVIPILQETFSSDSERCDGPFIHSWNCYYYEFHSKQELLKVWPDYHKNKLTVGELWLGFLRYFLTEFDWKTKVVTIRQMKSLTKFDKWWMSKCMCIEDPFNLEHNLAAGITGQMKTYILERFSAALSYHSESIHWMKMPHMMDKEALIGDSRSPKFLVCNLCNGRNHKAQQCPSKKKTNQKESDKKDKSRTTKETTGNTNSSLTSKAQKPNPTGAKPTNAELSQEHKKPEQIPERELVGHELIQAKRNPKKQQELPHQSVVDMQHSSPPSSLLGHAYRYPSPFVSPQYGHPSSAYFSPPLSTSRFPSPVVYNYPPSPFGSLPQSANPAGDPRGSVPPHSMYTYLSPFQEQRSSSSPLVPIPYTTNSDYGNRAYQSVPQAHTQEFQPSFYQGRKVLLPSTSTPMPVQQAPSGIHLHLPQHIPSSFSHGTRNKETHGGYDQHAKTGPPGVRYHRRGH